MKLASMWQERAPQGPWFIETQHDGHIFFGSDIDSAKQCMDAINRHAQRPHDPVIIAAVQQAIMRHPHFDGGPATAFGFANTAIDAYTTARSSTDGKTP